MATKTSQKKQSTNAWSLFRGLTRTQLSIFIVAIVFGVLGVYELSTSHALSSKGGHSTPTLTVSPDPSALDYVGLTVSGCGYDPSSLVTLNDYPVNAPGATFSLGFDGTETTDSAGCFTTTPFDHPYTSVPGIYGFKAYATTIDKNNHVFRKLVAETTFTVQ